MDEFISHAPTNDSLTLQRLSWRPLLPRERLKPAPSLPFIPPSTVAFVSMAQLRPRCIGILREVKNKWERRTPLTPSDVSVFTSAGVRVLVQPSTLRIFTDSEFAAAGATITDDLSPANTILGVKEFPASSLLPNRSYLIFSHTIKAQPANMAFLDECRRQRVRLFDYETIRSRDGKRLVAFGQYAGIAGMIDGLRGVGERLLSKGYSSPFMGVGSAYMYPSIDSAKRAVEYCGEEIRRVGLPKPLLPFRVVFTGAGNVTQGAQSVFEALPHQYVDPAALPSVKPDPHTLYAAKVSAEHMVQHAQGQPFNKAQYYDNPSEYVPVFHERVAPHTSLLVNGMYWDNRYPRLITLEQYRRLQQSNAPLLAVADITCDVKGSVEMLQKSTTIEQPFFVYDGVTGEMSDRVEGDGVLMLGVDNLPAEFPRDASTHFSSKLKPFIEALASNDNDVPLNDNVALPPELLNACITSEGELTANFAYIDKLRQANTIAAAHEPHLVASTTAVATAQSTTITPVSVKLLLSGHLLDTQFINTAFDVLEDRAADFRVLFFDVSPNRSTRRDNHSHCVIEAHFDSAQRMEDAIEAVQALAAVMNKAEAKITRLNVEQGGASTFSNTATDGRPKQSSTRGHFGSVAVTSAAFSKPTAAATIASRAFSSASRPALRVPYSQPSSAPSAASSSSASSTYVAGSSRPHIVVLGSGFVAAPMVEWLAKQGYPVTVASNALADAQRITQSFDNCTAVTLDASDTAATSSLIASSAITVSLLPHTMHVPIARLCLQHSKHLLTASYVSPAMRALHDEAASRGLVFMNELGLDPGIGNSSSLPHIASTRWITSRADVLLNYCACFVCRQITCRLWRPSNGCVARVRRWLASSPSVEDCPRLTVPTILSSTSSRGAPLACWARAYARHAGERRVSGDRQSAVRCYSRPDRSCPRLPCSWRCIPTTTAGRTRHCTDWTACTTCTVARCATAAPASCCSAA